MSSLKMTFSLASLILILGLVFAPTAVMAHSDAQRGDPATVGTHTHPVLTAVTADTGADPPVLAVPTHNAHPMVQSIMLKEGDTVRGDMVAVDDTTNTTFTLVVTFDRDVVSAASETDTSNNADGDLADSELTTSLLNVDRSAATGTTNFAITRVADSHDAFEVVVTPAAYPSGTAEANDKELKFRIQVNAGAVFSVRTNEIPPGSVASTPIDGGASSESVIREFTLVDALQTMPGAPENLVATAGVESVTLMWDTVDDAMYEYSMDAGTTWMDVAAADAGDLTVDNLTAGTAVAFSVRVKATDDALAGAAAMDTATPTPAAPAGLTATAGVGSVALTWTAVPGTMYEYSMDSGATWMDVAATDAGNLTVSDLTAGTAVIFSVRVKAAGTALASAAALATATPTAAPIPVPAAPMELAATAGNAQVVLSWDAPTDTSITGHQSRQSDDDGTTWTAWADSTTVPDKTHTVTGLTNGTEYTFEVRAMNATGPGAASSVMATPMAPLAVPGPVTGLTAMAGDEQVTLSWTAPAAMTGGAVTGYEYNMGSTWMAITGSDATTTSHIVTGLTNGQTYTFQVRAMNASGSGGASNSIIATPMETPPPAAPATISATAGDGKVTLTWAAVTGATSYEYSKDGGTAWAAIGDELVTNDDGTLSYTVTALTNGTEVSLTVRAVGPGGNGAASAAAKATPMAAATGGLATGDTRDNVTSETEFPLSGSLAPGAFVVIAPMARGDIAGTEIVIADLPNLQRFFARGGTISLVGGSAKSVVITEIMWGLNSSAAIGSQANHQWIELYNTDNKNTDGKGTATPATVDLSTYKLVFTPTTTLPKPANLADQVSNVELGGWTVNVGSSGALGAVTATFSPVNLVSMYRNIVYDNVTKVHNKDDAADNRKKQLNAIPSGNNAAGWMASTASDTFAPNQLGSPGAAQFVGRAVFDATSVGRNAVVITEVGNNGNDAYDWVELTAIANTNLEKYELQYIEGQNITVLAQFVKKELKAGEILLVVQSDPRNNPDHPIAAGKVWKLADADRDNTGTDSLYHVDGKLKIPNDKGKALFVLRNEKDKKDHNNIVDLAGNSFVTDTSSAYRTNLWPLRATKAGHGNVIDGDVEDFNSGRVYQRNDRGSGTGEKDWSVRGWTGIGYKRSAANNGQNGGTPGFDNGSLKEKSSDLAGGASVSISEVMYDRGSRNNLPQWIELSNDSATQSINLNEWKLKIENANDVDVRNPAVTIANLGGTIIPPNQTILIVGYTTGRVSRGSQGGIDFPSHRVIALSGKGELEIPAGVSKRNFRLLSTTTFKLTLMEKGGGMVDTVGNMGATTAWDLPMSGDGEGRSSIIRRYDAGVARDGTMEDAWILASTSDLAEVRVNETYYGSPDDIGTPGYRGGGPLPVSLSKFRPERLDTGEIVVRWITESELNNAGFNILRSEKRDGEFTKVHFKAGQGTTSERTVYEWKDKTAKPNVVYYYQIQDVSLDGEITTLRQSRLKGDISPAGKLTTTWGELKALR